MKKTVLRLAAALSAGAVLLVMAPVASARADIDWSISIGNPMPAAVYGPPPVIYSPPPVVYGPPPVYAYPQPVYVQPAPVVRYGPVYQPWRGGHYVEHRHGNPHWRHHRHGGHRGHDGHRR